MAHDSRTRVRRGLAVTGLALITALSGVVFAPSAGAAPLTAQALPATESGQPSGVPAPGQYLISYQGNRGVGTAPAVQRVQVGGSATIAANPFVLDYYEFTGWNSSSDGTGTTYQPAASVVPTADLVLYAQWKYRIEVQLYTSAAAQVYRTTDPQQFGVFVGSPEFGWDFGDGEELESPGTIQIRNKGVLVKSLAADPFGFAETDIPTNLPLGKAEFTATFVPTAVGEKSVTSDPVRFTIARATTLTTVTLHQQALSAADQKKFRVRSAMSVSVQVAGVGTRTAAPGKVAVNVGGKVTTLTLVNGKAQTAPVPTAAGTKTVVATYQPGLDWWVRSTGRAAITVR